MSREVETDADGLIRLQKLLAQSGVASRRKCEELMLDGQVDVRVQHLVALARLLQVHPMEFLELGFPDWPVHHHLTDWMRPDLRKRARKRPGLPSTRVVLAERVRGIVQEELDAREAGPPRRSGKA